MTYYLNHIPNHARASIQEGLAHLSRSSDSGYRDLYSGIARVQELFDDCNARYERDNQFLVLLSSSVDRNYIIEPQVEASLVRVADTNQSNYSDRLDTLMQMDYYQWFVLCHVEPAQYQTVMDCYHVLMTMTNQGDSVYFSAFMRIYDILCGMAYENYRNKIRSGMFRTTSESHRLLMAETNTYLIDKVIRHEGCDAGKKEFLSGIPQMDTEEWSEHFDCEYEVTIQITMTTNKSVMVPGGENPEDFIDDWLSDQNVGDLGWDTYGADVEVTHFEEA